ncbi:MAG: outer-membrane lipoprotein carrier protein LolA [Elusimicrobiaceae bacterium]|nr:outer-membrane lipoprotein carrier protein LolA [Elusimicrobiaceae bacterium]
MKRHIGLTILSLLAASAHAASAGTAGQPSPASTAAVTIAAPQPRQQTAVALSSTAVIEKLREWDTKLESLSCGFTQSVKFGDSGMGSTIEGLVRYRKPDLLRVEHTAPRSQIVVTDKKTISVYSPQDRQLVKSDWTSWISQQSAIFSGVTNFGSYGKIIADHGIKVTTGETGVAVTLSPVSGKQSYTLTLLLDPEMDYFPYAIEMKIGTTDVKTTLKKITINSGIPDGVFTLNPPQGTKIINF